jgi:[phosphatase 2A protein]-leucine-carboxy methyltransferase
MRGHWLPAVMRERFTFSNLPAMFPPAQHSHNDTDAPIRATDTDASLARLSAVKKNYLDDAFIRHLVPRAHLQPARPPLINIGTFVRSESIDMLVEGWIRLSCGTGKKCQIVSFGAGSDTRFWRLAVGRFFVRI